MRARVKSTGEIVEVYFDSRVCDKWINEHNGWKLYSDDELEFIHTSQKQSVTIEGWVARSRWGVYLYSRKPYQVLGDWEGTIMQRLSEYSFPDLKWEDEPRKVKITIEEV